MSNAAIVKKGKNWELVVNRVPQYFPTKKKNVTFHLCRFNFTSVPGDLLAVPFNLSYQFKVQPESLPLMEKFDPKPFGGGWHAAQPPESILGWMFDYQYEVEHYNAKSRIDTSAFTAQFFVQGLGNIYFQYPSLEQINTYWKSTDFRIDITSFGGMHTLVWKKDFNNIYIINAVYFFGLTDVNEFFFPVKTTPHWSVCAYRDYSGWHEGSAFSKEYDLQRLDQVLF